MKLLVLGGGQQGRVIASDLAASVPGASVTVADVRRPSLDALSNLAWVGADLSDAATLASMMREHDLVVGALPSGLGFNAMRAAIAARRPMVDVSFSAEDPLTLDAEARRAGVPILPDCGLAPGLSHLLAGRFAARHGTPDAVTIYVGGVAQDASRPYGYVVTWSLDDLHQEYLRPARIVRDGHPETVPVFSGIEHIVVPGVGEMEAFYSDGLRTAVETMPGIADMGEKTLRWPGHVEAVRPLVEAGTFVEEIRARCTADPPEDLVVLLVRARWGSREADALLVDRYDPASRLTAMARTTALTTSAVAQLLAGGFQPEPGVHPLERLAAVPGAFEGITGALARHGVRVAVAPPA